MTKRDLRYLPAYSCCHKGGTHTKENINEKIYLADIAGYREEKEEAVKLVDILQNFALYKACGASIPKGLLLCGEPGVGKTMFAKAISTEANVPLYEFDADESENEEETIKTLKLLFKKAKETIPSIVFIDELDELISSVDSGAYGFQSDYSRKTLKTLLTEIDGISSSDGILVIATSNRKRGIPPALIRSGRLEKQITFRLPSIEDRAAIAALYLKKAHASVNPNDVARKTDGFSGADIKSLVNAALIESVRKKEELTLQTIISVIPTIRFGEIKKVNKEGPLDYVCYHEIGHFLAQYGLNGEIGSISVETYGDVAGFVASDEEFDSPLRPKKDNRSAKTILDSIAIDLGGLAGEEVFLGERYCGSSEDLSNAFEKILNLLMCGAMGFEYLPSFDVEKLTRGRRMSLIQPNKNYVDARSAKIVEILNEKFDAAKQFIIKWRGLGEMIFPILKEKESLTTEELSVIVDDYRKEHPDEIRA